MFKENSIRLGIALVAVALVAIVFIKPTINSNFHDKYLENLNQLETLGDSLVRNHLLVTNNQVNHYDYIEADLLNMERTAELAKLTPGHAGKLYHEEASQIIDSYLVQLNKIREHTELTKRGLGLLKNSRAALKVQLAELNDYLSNKNDTQVKSIALQTLVKLNQAVSADSSEQVITHLLDELEQMQLNNPQLLNQIRLHARIIDNYSQPTIDASLNLYTAVDELEQPGILRSSYLKQYDAIAKKTNYALIASYSMAVCLVALALLLSIVSARAKKEAHQSSVRAAEAAENTTRQLNETQAAVSECNELLTKISCGDFSKRIENEYSIDALETLKSSVNSTADHVELTMSELQRVLVLMRQGDFTAQIDSRVTGDFRTEVDNTNTYLNQTIQNITSVMDSMKQGDFSNRVNVDMFGSFDSLKMSINSSLDALSQSINEIVTVVDKQAHGEFGYRVMGQWPGELNKLSQSLNSTADTISTTVKQIKSLSKQVVDASSLALDNSKTLQQQSDAQAQSIEKALDTAHLIKDSIESNRDSTNLALQYVEKSHNDATKCQQASTTATLAMENVTNKTNDIRNATSTINSIASKTNLLSLNAAVEAVKANEHGKGFSVVAGEVKALARMSADASAEIDRIIQATNVEIQDTASSVQEASSALGTISDSIADVKDIAGKISAASATQITEIDSMTTSVNEAYQMTNVNKNLASDSHTMSCELDELSKRMTSLVEFFQTDETPVHTHQLKKAA